MKSPYKFNSLLESSLRPPPRSTYYREEGRKEGTHPSHGSPGDSDGEYGPFKRFSVPRRVIQIGDLLVEQQTLTIQPMAS